VAGKSDKERKPKANAQGETVLVKNRRATFDYEIEDSYEGGLVLVGSEVKSMRAGKVEMVDAYCSVDHGEMYLKQMYVAPFEQASAFPHDPRRARKVLLHAHEIQKLHDAVARDGMTLVPLRLYLTKGRVKIEIAVAKGRKSHDKRAAIKEKTADREARSAIRRERK
jgi:SsrA-binding protein